MREKERRKKKKKKIILKKLYSVADPLIQRLPGRDVEEKRVVFNLIIIILVAVLYLSPLTSIVISTRTVWSVALAILLLVTAPMLVMYLLDLVSEYSERIRVLRKQALQEKKRENI